MVVSGSENFDHPYVPRDLKLEDYAPVFLSQSTIVGVYGLSSLLVFSILWILSGITLKLTICFQLRCAYGVKFCTIANK